MKFRYEFFYIIFVKCTFEMNTANKNGENRDPENKYILFHATPHTTEPNQQAR